jgi:hypothetical protein
VVVVVQAQEAGKTVAVVEVRADIAHLFLVPRLVEIQLQNLFLESVLGKVTA